MRKKCESLPRANGCYWPTPAGRLVIHSKAGDDPIQPMIFCNMKFANWEGNMKANALFIVLGFVLSAVLDLVFEIDSLLLKSGIIGAIAIAVYAGLKVLERAKHQES